MLQMVEAPSLLNKDRWTVAVFGWEFGMPACLAAWKPSFPQKPVKPSIFTTHITSMT
jgi:hypothetical protein